MFISDNIKKTATELCDSYMKQSKTYLNLVWPAHDVFQKCSQGVSQPGATSRQL